MAGTARMTGEETGKGRLSHVVKLSELTKLLTAVALVGIAILALGTIPKTAFVHEITGFVTKVYDGDTIWVRANGTREKVRLDRIDAPEANQPFGNVSTTILRNRIFDKTVTVKYNKRDQYGRLLGIVFLNDEDINLWMLTQGAAWHYKHFDHTPAYAEAEAKAKAARIGLWKDDNPINPYVWRKQQQHGTNLLLKARH